MYTFDAHKIVSLSYWTTCLKYHLRLGRNKVAKKDLRSISENIKKVVLGGS
jgi:hypothetical protein